MTQSYVGTKQVLAWEQEKDNQPGYAVKYQDGYVSWSPKAVFEESYLPIGHVDHLPPHQQRVIAERVQLADKVNKLAAFFSTSMFQGLPERQKELLKFQHDAMAMYLTMLDLRIKEFE